MKLFIEDRAGIYYPFYPLRVDMFWENSNIFPFSAIYQHWEVQLVEILLHGKHNELSMQGARASAATSSNMWPENMSAFSVKMAIYDLWVIAYMTLVTENIHCLATTWHQQQEFTQIGSLISFRLPFISTEGRILFYSKSYTLICWP